MKAFFQKKEVHKKDIIQSVFRALALQSFVIFLFLSIFIAYFWFSATARFFHALKPMIDIAGEKIAEEFKVDPSQENAVKITKKHELILFFYSRDEDWIAYQGAITPASEYSYLDFPVNYSRGYRINEDSSFGVYWPIEFFGISGHGYLIAAWLSGFVILFILIYWFIRRTLRPLRWVQEGITEVTNNNLNYCAPDSGKDVKNELAHRFNTMIASLRELITSKDRLIADVSHELRSPITRMKLALEMMPEDEKTESVKKNIVVIEEIITAILEDQRINLKTMALDKTRFSMGELVSDVVSLHQTSDTAIDINMEPNDTDVQIEADRSLIKLLIHNLIDNAVKYSLPDSQAIQVNLTGDESTIHLSIVDDGQGIDDDKIDKVFQPFYKISKSRGFNSGYGLGLSLCKRIVEVHQGRIELILNKPRGIEVSLALKRTF